MTVKISDAVGSASKTTATVDFLEDVNVPRETKRAIQEKVGEYLKNEILKAVADQTSPVSGERWPGLSKGYKKLKEEAGLPGEANMEASGAMLDDLEFKPSETGIEIGFWGAEADKADGHNKLSGRSNNTPKRRFLPAEGQNFKSDIRAGIEEIISAELAENADIPQSALKDVSTKSELYDVLRETFGSMSRSDIRLAVLGNQDLVELLDEADLLDLL